MSEKTKPPIDTTMAIEFTLNDEIKSVRVAPTMRLLDLLRDTLGLTGTKEGCGEGECGACSVLVDGRLVNSCLIPVAQIEGSEVVSIEGEGLGERGDQLNLIQETLLQYGGTQCGICTPGIVISIGAALKREPEASRQRIRQLIAGNLCRCTGYQQIVDAAIEAARRKQGQEPKEAVVELV